MSGRDHDDFASLLEAGDADVLAALVTTLPPLAPSAGAWERLSAATSGGGRLARFAGQLAALIDVSVDKAKELLDRVTDLSSWERDLVPGLDALWVEGGPAVASCIRGFARLRAGAPFPVHHHLGDETTLVLEGAMIESGGRVVRPGETLTMRGDDHAHAYHAAPGGTDLLFFVVVREGIAFEDGARLLHRDPVEP